MTVESRRLQASNVGSGVSGVLDRDTAAAPRRGETGAGVGAFRSVPRAAPDATTGAPAHHDDARAGAAATSAAAHSHGERHRDGLSDPLFPVLLAACLIMVMILFAISVRYELDPTGIAGSCLSRSARACVCVHVCVLSRHR